MKISFVVPAYNEEALLEQCLHSIRARLVEAGGDGEIIVVNNASNDRTREIAVSVEGVRVVDEPQKGLTRARAAGFAASSGTYLANIDADVILPPQWITNVFKKFDNDPTLVAVGGPSIYYDAPTYIRAVWYVVIGVQYIFSLLHIGAVLNGGSTVAKRSAVEAAGGFNTKIEFYGEDAEFTSRLAKIGTISFIPRLYVLASGRRIVAEGLFTMMLRYSINSLSASFFGKPVTRVYRDIRMSRRDLEQHKEKEYAKSDPVYTKWYKRISLHKSK